MQTCNNFFPPHTSDVQVKYIDGTDALRTSRKIILRLINEPLRSEGLNHAADH